jgi:hypothetical protein
VDDNSQVLALCDRIEQDLAGIRRAAAPAQGSDVDPILLAASAVEVCQTLRRHCDELFRSLLEVALECGVPARVLDMPGD